MSRTHRHGAVSGTATVEGIQSPAQFPKIHLDPSADFASIKLSPGVEAKTYLKDGFVFCEDAAGHIIEVQILNLSQLKQWQSAPVVAASLSASHTKRRTKKRAMTRTKPKSRSSCTAA